MSKPKRSMTLPTDSATRKGYPLLSGCLKYFPAALAGVAAISKIGNDKHNPGQALHHARGKSNDHGDCILRHLTDTEDLLAAHARKTGDIPTEQTILTEANQLAWRALAYVQALHEQFGAPLAPGAIESIPAIVYGPGALQESAAPRALQVGDLVRIKFISDERKTIYRHDGPGFVPEMKKLIGATGRITGIFREGNTICVCGFDWLVDDLELVAL